MLTKAINSFTAKAIVLIFVILLVYWGTWNGYFQQDEWLGIGNYFGLNGDNIVDRLIQLYSHMFSNENLRILFIVPLVNYIRYSFFQTNFTYYALLAVLLHMINSVLVFLFMSQLRFSKKISLLSSILFSVLFLHVQAVTWVSTSTTTQLAFLLSITTIIFFEKWLHEKMSRHLALSGLFLAIAMGVKETSYFLLPLLLGLFIYKRTKKGQHVAVFAGLFYLVSAEFSRYFSSNVGLFAKILFPFKSTSQILFPEELINYVSGYMVEKLGVGPAFGTTAYDVFLQSKMIYPLMVSIGLIFWIIAFSVFMKDKKLKNIFIFLALFYFLSAIPLLFVSSRELTDIFFSPRNLYLNSAGVVGVVGLFLTKFYKRKYVVLLVLTGIIINMVFARRLMGKQTESARVRKSIVNAITKSYETLPDKVVFYVVSDRSYYGLPEKTRLVPFQSGFGRTLLVLYYPKEHFSSEFFNDLFLYPIESQGYKEFGERGFGYFRDFDKLQEVVIEYNIPIDSVIAFSWQHEIEEFKDTSDEVREKLSKI